MNVKKSLGVVIMLGIIFTAACSGKDNTDAEQKAENQTKDPFTMTIWGGGVSADEFNDRFRGVIAKKFPYITVDYIVNGKGTTMTDLVTSGRIPDLIRTDIPTLNSGYLDLQLGEDLNAYVKKYKVDLKRFNKVFIDEVIDAGRTGELYGLPVPPFFPQVLYYNKDLFNRFGVPYPKDGMSWDEIYEIAKKMTRVDSGQVYRGFSGNMQALLRDNVYSLPILDPNADQLADSAKWQTLFNNFKRFYEIENNKPEATIAKETTVFNNGRVAMQANQHNVYLVIPPEIDWDIVSAPTIAGAPKLMGQRGPAYWAISKTSKYKDEAFQVIMEMLSDEVQLEDSKKGIPTTLVNKDIQKALGQGHVLYDKKNMKSISFYEPIPYTVKRKPGLPDVPGGTQQTLLGNAFMEVVLGKADVNTALRKLDEQLKAEVAKVNGK